MHCPAFGEEMNKSRHLLADTARRLSAKGACVWIPDLLGTGDSSAPFRDANWSAWIDDLDVCAQEAMRYNPSSLVFWGCRLGALLAVEMADHFKSRHTALLLWQPVLSGKQFLRQFFRLSSVSAQAFDEQTGELPETRLQAGENCEVAGYEMSPANYASLVEREAPPLSDSACRTLLLFEVSPEPGKTITAKAARWLESAREDQQCIAKGCKGDLFWASQERGYAPELIDATEKELLSNLSDPLSPAAPASASLADPHASSSTFVFDCGAETLVGHIRKAREARRIGVLIVVGGPQYRAGSHRLFVKLSDKLSDAGYSCMSFDYRGIGDASGESPGFENIGTDLSAAVAAFQVHDPAVDRVVLWGLCDGATAGVLHAANIPMVSGLILANPWVFSEETKAQALIATHYRARLFSGRFWRRLLSGEVDFWAALTGFASILRQSRPASEKSAEATDATGNGDTDAPLPDRFAANLKTFDGHTQLILSGKDVTAAEFQIAMDGRGVRTSATAADPLPRVRLQKLSSADHTFSKLSATQAMTDLSLDFLNTVASSPDLIQTR